MPRRVWSQVRLRALDRDGWRCRKCGRAGRLEVHHVKALEYGGEALELENLLTLCRDCHIKIHGGEPQPGPDLEYLALVQELLFNPLAQA